MLASDWEMYPNSPTIPTSISLFTISVNTLEPSPFIRCRTPAHPNRFTASPAIQRSWLPVAYLDGKEIVIKRRSSEG
jgi:hypothetical protein